MRKFICFDKEDQEAGDLYINPEFYCTINIKIGQQPKDDCVCEWKMDIDRDTWSRWKCGKCGGRVSAEFWE